MTELIDGGPTGEIDIASAGRIYSALQMQRPQTKADLKNYVKVFLGLDIPAEAICDEHNAPLDYLAHTFFSDFFSDSLCH